MKYIFIILLTVGASTPSIRAHAQAILDRAPEKGEVIYRCAPCGCEHDDVIFEAPGKCPSCNMTLNASLHGFEPLRRKAISVSILLFDGADIMDVTGPWSVFSHSGLQVSTVAKSKDDILLSGGLHLTPDYSLEELPKVNVLVVPGGGPAESNQDTEIVDWLKARRDSVETMFSVCSGAFFLGKAGILDGQQATTFASLIPQLEQEFPKAEVLRDVKYTNGGSVFTSAGLSSGIEASYHVLAKYYGQGFAQNVANHMEYNWDIRSDYARTQLADNYLLPLQPVISLFTSSFSYSYGNNDQWEYRFDLRDEIELTQFFSTLKEELKGLITWNKSNKNGLSGTIGHEALGPGIIRMFGLEHMGKRSVTIEASRTINSGSSHE